MKMLYQYNSIKYYKLENYQILKIYFII